MILHHRIRKELYILLHAFTSTYIFKKSNASLFMYILPFLCIKYPSDPEGIPICATPHVCLTDHYPFS